MLAIAFESIVKLVALLAVGPFVVWVHVRWPRRPGGRRSSAPDNPGADRGRRRPETGSRSPLLAGLAFLCLPRQFHVAVVEHDHPESLRQARWLFPLYMLLINIFVVPIALAGLTLPGPAGIDPDLFVLALPLSGGNDGCRSSSSSAGCRRPPAWWRSPAWRSPAWSATSW